MGSILSKIFYLETLVRNKEKLYHRARCFEFNHNLTIGWNMRVTQRPDQKVVDEANEMDVELISTISDSSKGEMEAGYGLRTNKKEEKAKNKVEQNKPSRKRNLKRYQTSKTAIC